MVPSSSDFMQHCPGGVLANAIKLELKQGKNIQKEESKLPLFAHDMTIQDN